MVSREHRIVVDVGDGHQRIDRLLAARLGVGRRRLSALFSCGRVRVDGRVVPKSFVPHAGQVVTADPVESDEAAPEPAAPLRVHLVNAQVVVVEKPAGQPSAVLRAGDSGTLANALVGRYPEMAEVGYSKREPGLVHRLDTGTSGLLVAARSPAAFLALREGLKQGALEKRYLAIVPVGLRSQAGTFSSWLGTHPRDRRRVVAASGTDGLRAAERRTTHWRVIRENGPWQLLELLVSSAYRHQIRAHLAAMGVPIAGDVLYGGARHPGFDHRHALHASYVAWAGDTVVAAFAAQAELPSDMARLLEGP